MANCIQHGNLHIGAAQKFLNALEPKKQNYYSALIYSELIDYLRVGYWYRELLEKTDFISCKLHNDV